MSFWSIPKSSTARWRALMLVCELCICVLWIAAVVIALVMPAGPVFFDHGAEKAYLADQAQAMAPAAYVTLGISVLLGAAATYRRRFPDGKELFWPAVLFTVLGLVWAANAWPHIPLCK